jgi:hypothetical protein
MLEFYQYMVDNSLMTVDEVPEYYRDQIVLN